MTAPDRGRKRLAPAAAAVALAAVTAGAAVWQAVGAPDTAPPAVTAPAAPPATAAAAPPAAPLAALAAACDGELFRSYSGERGHVPGAPWPGEDIGSPDVMACRSADGRNLCAVAAGGGLEWREADYAGDGDPAGRSRGYHTPDGPCVRYLRG